MMMDMFAVRYHQNGGSECTSPVYAARSRRIGAPFRQVNPLFRVADEIAAEGDILCFDEFFVFRYR